jgi:hypothetical protein
MRHMALTAGGAGRYSEGDIITRESESWRVLPITNGINGPGGQNC